MPAFCLCLSTLKISIHFEKDSSCLLLILKIEMEGLTIQSSKDCFYFSTILLWFFLFVCLFHFSIFKDQVAGECVGRKTEQNPIELTAIQFLAQPSWSLQHKKKREHAGAQWGKRDGGQQRSFGISHCASSQKHISYLVDLPKRYIQNLRKYIETGRNAKY